VHDGDVFVSQDEGKSWSKADGIPSGKAAMVIEHPFNNRVVGYFYLLLASNTDCDYRRSY
jgi:hypothetical protein